MRNFAFMKHRIITLIFSILSSLSSFAEHDGKPWDADSFHGTDIGPLFLGIIIFGIVFYVIPKLASASKKPNDKNKGAKKSGTNSTSVNPQLTICPTCNGKGIIHVQRYICPYCGGYGHKLTEEDKSIVRNALGEPISIPQQIIDIPQDILENQEYDILSLLYHLPNPFVIRSTDKDRLIETPKCNHCKGVGSVDTKLCTCFFDEQGNYTGHRGYIYR